MWRLDNACSLVTRLLHSLHFIHCFKMTCTPTHYNSISLVPQAMWEEENTPVLGGLDIRLRLYVYSVSWVWRAACS